MKRCLSLLLLVVSVLRAHAAGSLSYTVEAKRQDNRTDLVVIAKWKEKSAAPIEVGMPHNYYGSPDLSLLVEDFEGMTGTSVESMEDKHKRRIIPAKDGSVAVRYRMAFRPEIIDDASFAPLFTPKQVQAFGCQWMLQIGNLDEDRRTTIDLLAPKGWSLYTTLSPDAHRISVQASYSTLVSCVIGMGDVARHRFQVKGKPVDVYVGRGFALKDAEVFRKIEAVVKVQRGWFGDYGQDFYVIPISVRPDNIAGTAVHNGFVCFVKADVKEAQLLGLLSHEMLHNWIPGKMHVENPGEEDRWEWEWFDEGFAEYFGRKVLLDSHSITKAQFADLLNRDLINIADNPVRTSTYDQVKADIAAGKFSVAHKKLSYYRGAVMAANWDARIAARSHGKRSLSDAIRDLYRLGAKTSGRLTKEQFFAFIAKEGIDARKEQSRYILGGEILRPEPSGLGSGFKLVQTSLPAYDLGFDLSASLRDKKVVGLVAGGPGDRAGLREGMRLERVNNSNRFGNAWDSALPFSVWVEKDGRVVKVDYWPRGAKRPVPQFVAKPAR